MPLELREIEKALENKLGFDSTEGAKHRLFSLYIGGKLVAETKTSRGSGYKTISDHLVAQMARQVLVPNSFFVGLVRCAKTKADYLQLLAKRRLAPLDELPEK